MKNHYRIDSRLLFFILKRIGDFEPNSSRSDVCREIGIYDDNHQNRFSKGDIKKCYWPPHNSWFSILRSREGDQKDHFDEKQPFPLKGEEAKSAIDYILDIEYLFPAFRPNPRSLCQAEYFIDLWNILRTYSTMIILVR